MKILLFEHPDSFLSLPIVPFCSAVDQGTPAKITESLHLTQEQPALDEESFSDEGSGTPSFESIYDFSDFPFESINIQDYYHNPNAMQWHPPGSTGTPVPTDERPSLGSPVDSLPLPHPLASSGTPPLPHPLGDYEEGEEGETLGSWHRRGRSSLSERAQMLISDQPNEGTQQAGDV